MKQLLQKNYRDHSHWGPEGDLRRAVLWSHPTQPVKLGVYHFISHFHWPLVEVCSLGHGCPSLPGLPQMGVSTLLQQENTNRVSRCQGWLGTHPPTHLVTQPFSSRQSLVLALCWALACYWGFRTKQNTVPAEEVPR